jgi:hypothetical protein
MVVELEVALPNVDDDDARRIGRDVDDGRGLDDGTTNAVVATAMPMVMIRAMFFMVSNALCKK